MMPVARPPERGVPHRPLLRVARRWHLLSLGSSRPQTPGRRPGRSHQGGLRALSADATATLLSVRLFVEALSPNYHGLVGSGSVARSMIGPGRRALR